MNPSNRKQTRCFSFTRLRRVGLHVVVCWVSVVGLSSIVIAEERDFTSDARLILSKHCFACHGPDTVSREADLRLDTQEGIARVATGKTTHNSELIRRIRSTDDDVVMPPSSAHKPMSESDKQILERWIQAGGRFGQHWAFAPIRKHSDQMESIDYWIDRGIQRANLQANEIADRRTLIRRLCLDLLGLPPTREQVAEFLNDESVDAYSRLVDRLQQSPHYAENMARYWLDLVRYGDTHGLHLDNYREMWPYRDWVIDAFRQNMPFNQFVTEQLAGDLLPNATDPQKIASGFNRLNVTTGEGGSIYDEVFTRNVIDRTDAFGTIFLGLTTGCAVCHDHKFDPMTQRDYYSLAGYFNSLDGRALDGNVKDHPPVLRVLTDQQKEQIKQYDQEIASVRQQMAEPIETVDRAQELWEASLGENRKPTAQVLHPSLAKSKASVEMQILDDQSIQLVGDAADKDVLTIIAEIPTGAAWRTLRLDALVDKPEDRVGASANGNVVLTEVTLDVSDPEDEKQWTPVSIEHAIADIEQSDGAFGVHYAIDNKLSGREGWGAAGHQQTGPRTAWFSVPSLASDVENGSTKIRVQLKYQSVFKAHQFRRVRLTLSDAAPIVDETQRIRLGPIHMVGPFPVESSNPAYHRTFGSQGKVFNAKEEFRYEEKAYHWERRDDFTPVVVSKLPSIADRVTTVLLHQNLHSPKKQKVTMLFGGDDGHAIYLNGKRVAIVERQGPHNPLEHEYDLELEKGDNRLYIKKVNHFGDSEFSFAWRSPSIETPSELIRLVKSGDQTEDDKQSLQQYFRNAVCAHPDWLLLVDLVEGFEDARKKIRDQAATTLVWKELNQPRPSHVLNRGQYDDPGERVSRNTPAFLPRIKASDNADRLQLARWLCSEENPLTARVAVNRFWQQLFGVGLVQTSEDFGNQGEPPSHPELLDYLALEFQASGWDVNALVKQIVMSNAYRRSSVVDPQSLEIDPENRLLARGPRHRLDAEVLRDQSLAISGLLERKIGGPSVKPPQPDGLWYAVGFSRSNTAKFTADTDPAKIYRRSVYIFWKRTSAPPMMTIADAPSRENCTARRETTNTPLQALLLLNEVQYVEAAKRLAETTLANGTLKSDAQRVQWLFETVTMRAPNKSELAELVALVSDLTTNYSADSEAVKSLTGSDLPAIAAWTVLSSTLLNLDEVLNN